MNFIAIGVPLKGKHIINIIEEVDKNTKEIYITFQLKNRPKRALFIDGICVHPGDFCQKKIELLKEVISQLKINTSVPSEVYL